MDRTMKTISGLFVLLLLCVPLSLAGPSDKDKAQGLQKPNTDDLYRPFLINNIFNYYGNNGDGSYNKFSGDNEGFEFPKGSGKHIIFEDGVVWGGFHKGFVRPKVGGSVYRHGLQAGKLLTYGTPTTDPTADDPSLPKYRVYRVRPDINPNTPLDAAMTKLITDEEVTYISRYEAYSASDIYNQYIKDWNEWPAADGAPFKYGPGRGAPQAYDPTKDIPGQPGADQTLWYVANDESIARAANLSNSPPIGMEMQRTIWGYNRTGALGYVVFESTLLINKSGAPVDSMFMVQWTDPDLGDAGDDFVGCDVPRSLGYVYNGKPVDGTYGDKVPAGGFTFFQGPLVPSPGDSAVFRLHYRQGFKNLKMSAFAIFTQGVPALTDPAQGVNGDVQWYNLMNGKIAASGANFVNPKTGLAQKFVFDGDPVTGAGWVDGPPVAPPADRRMCLVTGPFSMAAGDTQELVVANTGAVGADRISSVSVLRYYSDLAQAVYNGLFNVAQAPPAPDVHVAALNNEISLDWGDPTTSGNTENFVSVGYAFEGYNVYQFPGVDISNPVRLATFDIVDQVTTIFDDAYDDATGAVLHKPVQFGGDFGLQRTFDIKTDKINSRGLVNGTKYFFGVTAYSFNPNPTAKPAALESPVKVLTIIPQMPNPGVRYAGAAGDTVKNVVQLVAPGGSVSEGQVIALITDPPKLTGHTYAVSFRLDALGNTIWDLRDSTTHQFILMGQTNQSGDGDYRTVGGLLIKVTGPATPGMKDWTVNNAATRHWTFADAQGFGLEGFEATIGNGFNNWFSGSTIDYSGLKNVEIRYATADGTWDPRTDQSANANFSKAYRYLRSASSPAAQPGFAPWIVNPTGGYAFQEFNWSVPFAAYDIEATPPRRLAVGHLENNQIHGLVDGRCWPGVNGGLPAGETNVTGTGPREWFFIFGTNYSTTADATLEVDILNNTVPMMWMGTVNRRSSAPNYVNGDTFTIIASHINSVNNTFVFTSPSAPASNAATAKADVSMINVFPNPYIGFNTQEVNKYNRFVTFSHLPKNATLRIFNLSGVLIRTLQKSDDTQFIQWDLKNESGFPAAAGMYVVYINMPDLGSTKTLKLGIIPEQQYIDRW